MSPIFSRHPRGELSAYVDAQLTEPRRQAIEDHLESCDRCRSEVEDVRAVRSALSALPEVAAPRSFAITAEQVAAPAAPPVERAAPSFTSGLRMASAGIAVALIAVVLADAGNITTSDDNDGTGTVAERNQAEPQEDGEFRATGADTGIAEDADVPAGEPSAAIDEGEVGSEEPAPADELAGGEEAAGVDPDAARADSGATREEYGLFPGLNPPVGYVFKPIDSNGDEDGGIEGFGTGSGGGTSSGGGTTGGVGGAVPESTDPPTTADVEAVPVPEAAEATGVPEDLSESDDGATPEEAPDALGDSDVEALTADDSDGLSTLQIIEIVLAIALGLALIGGFVLPRFLRRTA